VRFRNPQTGATPLILDQVKLSISDGEFVSLIGPSGCGKTTCINIVAGGIKPDSGTVKIDGTPATPGVINPHIAMMFARDALLPWRTAIANVTLAMTLADRPVDMAHARQLLRLVGLERFETYYPNQLSQGMRQRVALARTLAADREILLLDEPFAALDAQTKTLMQTEFGKIWEQDRKTVILVTHDLMEAIALSDRVVVMSAHPGRIKNIYTIDIPRPRVVIELYSEEQFLDLYRQLWDDLRVEVTDSN
jgi:NitT/TauT family transport system ATP-binding protein